MAQMTRPQKTIIQIPPNSIRHPHPAPVYHINHFNYTSVLDMVFLVLAAALVWRFLRTGGPAMLRMMNQPMEEMTQDG